MFRICVVFSLWVMTALSAGICDAAPTLAEQEKTLQQISEALADDRDLPQERLDKQRQELKDIRTVVGDISRAAEREKDRLQILIGALGSAPEEGEKEDDDIAEKRSELRQAISTQDARFKQASLLLTRTNATLDGLIEYEQARQRDRLFSRQAQWWQPSYIPDTIEGVRDTAELIEQVSLGEVVKSGILYVLQWLILLTISYGVMVFSYKKAGTCGLSNGKAYIAPLALFCMSASLLTLIQYRGAQLLTPDVRILCSAMTVLCAALTGALTLYSINTGEDCDMRKVLRHGLKLIRIGLWAAVPAVASGYVYLAAYIVLMAFSLLMALGTFITLRAILDHYARQEGTEEHPHAARRGLSPLGIALVEPLLAFLCLQIPLFFAGFHPIDVFDWFSRYKEGFTIGSIRFYPMDIVIGFCMFIALILLFRTIQWFLSGRVFPHTKLDIGVKNAAISLIGYAGILFAVISLLSALGINTSNLAIVAGALSVGIGFGLQAIISNFVSGLILLFERPVRVGDWVNVGGTEGFVKKINVRSTRIETFQRADILVPNSRFITEPVCNWTLYSASGRVEVNVGVAYGSDTEKVRDILLKVASEHTSALSYPAPTVLFVAFGASSLDFQLRCFLKDITRCLTVKSDLHFAVDKAFREAGIDIPFPQQDVYVKTLPASEITSQEQSAAKKQAEHDDEEDSV